MIQQPALDQQYSDLVDQLSAQNATFKAFVQGEATDTVALDNNRTIKTLAGVVADISQFHYVQKVVDHRLYSDVIAADSTLEDGLLVRVWGDTTQVNGLYLKASAGVYNKISYSDLYDLNTGGSGSGSNGTNGTNGTNGESAYQLAVDGGFVGTQTQWLASLVGPKGDDGADGTNGTNGTNGTDGAPGANGNTIITTAGVPDSSHGNNGDYAIDPNAQIIYGPKMTGAWPAGVSYKGAAGTNGTNGTNGNTILTTSGIPTAGTGNNGDYAIDPVAQIIYGPKNSGAWPAGVSYAGTGGSAPAVGTMRNIATRCRHNYQTWVTSTAYAFKSVTEHINQGSTVPGISVKYGNWYANNLGEFSTWTNSGTINYYAALEYPIGTFTLFEWSTAQGVKHARFGTAVPGANVESDVLGVTLPHGAKFKIHVIAVSASGSPITVTVGASSVTGGADNTAYWATSAAFTSDPSVLNLTGATTGSAGTGGAPCMYPLAIKGVATSPSVLLIGDSRLSGRADSTSISSSTYWGYTNIGYWGVGEVARSLDYAVPYTNAGCESDTALQFVASHALRVALAGDHTYVHVEYGVNDLTAGRNLATIQGNLNSIYGYFPTLKVSQSTIPPVTTSTDSWATATNQTAVASNPVRTALNDWIRTTPSPLWKYFEVADVVETSRNSGIWKSVGDASATSAVTGDGTHETPYGYNLIKLSGNINTALFT